MISEKILIHACCAPCSSYSVESLIDEGVSPVIYFYNPNIYPQAEFEKRQNELVKFCKLKQYELILGDEDFELWNKEIKGLEAEKEGGKRCLKCFALRLEKTAKLAKEKGYQGFTTVLTISPHKNSEEIIRIGKALALQYGVKFIEKNFKKNDGFKKSLELSKKYGFYRQNYCGCIFSIRK